jgi:hypothetical protein
MKSHWFHLKPDAVRMRKRGLSIGTVERKLGIPRSTLSGWFKQVRLTLNEKQRNGLVRARVKAVKWHNTEKAKRLKKAEDAAQETLTRLGDNRHTLELALALLYLGEGTKTNQTSMGNSNPIILRFFITALHTLYDIPLEKIRCELHLRADQDPKAMARYWSRELSVPMSNFINVSIDKRTAGKPTYPYYKGVCLVRCGQVAIQRKLVYIASGFCKRIASEHRP